MLITKNTVIADRWKVIKSLGSGAYGDVYSALDKKTKDEVAIKAETGTTATSLAKENIVYTDFSSAKIPLVGIPKPVCYLRSNSQSFFVMERLGDSILDICSSVQLFSLKTMLQIGIQMLDRLEFVHSMGWLHLDVKPENMMVGNNIKTFGIVYLIDFGLATRYIDNHGNHISYRTGVPFQGTRRYASIHVHEGRQRSRRDDIESLLYTLLFIYKGRLPWLPGGRAYKLINNENGICEAKKYSSRELCTDMPKQFRSFLRHVRRLKFEEQPKYSYLRTLLWNAFEENGYKKDGKLDWLP